MTIQLVITSDQAPARSVMFDQDLVTIGRQPDNALSLAHPQVSGHHCRIENRGGTYWAMDLGSTNGTLLNGAALPAAPGKPLQDGDTLAVGAFELRFSHGATTIPLDSTMVAFDAAQAAKRLGDQVARRFAGGLGQTGEARMAELRQDLQAALRELTPDQGRAVLSGIERRFGAGGAEEGAEASQSEQLYRAGFEVVRDLSEHYLGKLRFAKAEDVGRFGRLVQQALDVTLDWIAKSLQGREEFSQQFGADVTMLFSLEGNPIKKGGNAEQIGEYLLDWGQKRNVGDVRRDLEAAFRDLTLHQIGLLAAAQEAVRAILDRLSPAAIEALAQSKGKGWSALLPRGGREWDCYKEAHRQLVEERGTAFDELIAPAIRKGYLEAHERRGHGGKEAGGKEAGGKEDKERPEKPG